RMDDTSLTRNRPSSRSSTSPSASPPSGPAPIEMPQVSSPDAPPELKPELVPHGGSPATLGATVTAEGVNFAVYSETASALWVSIYDEVETEIGRFELDGHDDHVHHALITGIGAG